MTRLKLKCPICDKVAEPGQANYPFCSARCRTIDLGAWSAEEYVVSRPLNESDENLNPPDSTTQVSDNE